MRGQPPAKLIAQRRRLDDDMITTFLTEEDDWRGLVLAGAWSKYAADPQRSKGLDTSRRPGKWKDQPLPYQPTEYHRYSFDILTECIRIMAGHAVEALDPIDRDRSIEDLHDLVTQLGGRPIRRSKVELATDWIRATLTEPIPADTLIADGTEAGHHRRTLYRALDSMRKRREIRKVQDPDGTWWWHPKETT